MFAKYLKCWVNHLKIWIKIALNVGHGENQMKTFSQKMMKYSHKELPASFSGKNL